MRRLRVWEGVGLGGDKPWCDCGGRAAHRVKGAITGREGVADTGVGGRGGRDRAGTWLSRQLPGVRNNDHGHYTLRMCAH